MHLQAVSLVPSLLLLGRVRALSNVVANRDHPRDLFKRAEVDCGTWVMQCGGTKDGSGPSIEDVCNNACFFDKHLRHQDGSEYVATYRKGVDNDHNRIHSGCQINGKSVCTSMPFSQKMADGFNLEIPSCEEFPMADWTQNDFSNDGGNIRNALRCVEGRQNSAAGGQWRSFRDGTGEHAKRTCNGAMDKENTDYKFKIEMNLDNANDNLLGYCHGSSSDGASYIDPGEFWMNKLSFPNGANNFPLKDSDNDYQTGGKHNTVFQHQAVWQCKLELFRQTGDNYNVGMYDGASGEELAKGSKALNNDGDQIVLDPNGSTYPKLIVIRRGEMGKGGTPGSRIDFISSRSDAGNDLLTDFSFSTESQGWDARFKKVDGSGPEKGYYCDVPNIDDSSENGPTQQITCYYPCNTIG